MARPADNHIPSNAEWREGLYTPAILLFYAVYYFLTTALTTAIINGRPQDILFNIPKLKDEAFSRFWLALSAPPDPPPKPEELVGSAALVPPLMKQAEGVCLEIGPGSGTQTAYVDPSKITHYHLAEPATGLHPELRKNALRAGLTEKQFTVHAAGAEPQTLIPALARNGVIDEKGDSGAKFDTIICIRVLCSVSTPKETVQTLHHLLKPGGKLIVVEHVVNPDKGPWGSSIARWLQWGYARMGWSWFVGNCVLERDTEGVLREVGGWRSGTEGLRLSFWWSCLPYISGVLVKE